MYFYSYSFSSTTHISAHVCVVYITPLLVKVAVSLPLISTDLFYHRGRCLSGHCSVTFYMPNHSQWCLRRLFSIISLNLHLMDQEPPVTA